MSDAEAAIAPEARAPRAGRRPRIAYFFTDLPDQQGTFSFVELEEMARRGFDIEIFCLRTRLADGPGARRLRERFRVHQCGYAAPRALAATARAKVRRLPLYVRLLASCVRETASSPRILVKTIGIIPKCSAFAEEIESGDFDWIQAYWASLPARAAWWISAFTGVPYGTWAHAGADIYNRAHQTEPALRAVLERASLVLTCNEPNVEYFRRIAPGALPRVVLHPHGVDVGYFSSGGAGAGAVATAVGAATGDAAAPGAPEPRAEVRLLSVGRLSEAKGFDHAVRACRRLADDGHPFHYRIVGGGPEAAGLQALIDELGLRERVTLAGPLEQPELLAEYRAADIFLVPSIIGRRGSRDGLPNVLLEAMACGIPAIGSKVAAIPEAIDDGRTGLLVPPADPGALAAAIARLAGDAELRRRFAVEGRALVQTKYSREVCMNRLAEILKRAIGGKTPGMVREGSACASSS
jgi:glycosyltransferase involved in cell wall biosynthesis